MKLDLIERLSKTLKDDLKRDKSSIKDAFGAWVSDKSTDDIIAELREHRNFNRQIESF